MAVLWKNGKCATLTMLWSSKFKQVEEIVGISMSKMKREARKRKVQDTHNLFQ